jgi:hypothetical protein
MIVGDPEQLQAIEAGAPYRAIAERVGVMEMTDIRRQVDVWQKQATRDFASERTAEGLLAYEQHDNVHTFNIQDAAMASMIEQWEAVRRQSLSTSQIMLAYTRDEVRQLNERARTLRHTQGELGSDQVIDTSRGERTFAEQDRIYFLRNEKRSLHVKNGSLGTIERIRDNQLVVRLDHPDGDQVRRVEFCVKDYNDIDHGYAATVYKAQGVTVDRTQVLASTYFDRHSTYVAMSRHREGADLYMSRDTLSSFTQLSTSLGRERTKDVTLDYSQERGIDLGESQRLADREQPTRAYSTQLTDERFVHAEERLAQRQYDNALTLDIAALSKKTGLSLSLELKEGEQGIYRGMVELVGRYYGVMEQDNGMAKLIKSKQLDSRQQGKAMLIEKHIDYKGQATLKGIQPEIQRQRSLDSGLSLGD